MNRKKLAEQFTVLATNLSKTLLKKRVQHFSLEQYGAMKKGSLGKLFHQYITRQKIEFQPNLIRHDLKHILLGYEMKLEDEIRLNAFLIGNRSYNLLAMIYLSVCLVLLPEMVTEAKKHFKKGRTILPLKNTELQSLATQHLKKCRQQFRIPQSNPILA